MNRALSLGIAFALSALAVWLVRGEPKHTPAEAARDLARPFVLPALWARIEAAERSGELPVAAAVARTMLRYLPEWTDGHMHFAARIAFDHGNRVTTVEEKLDALDAGIAWLEEARTGMSDPAAAAELAAAQATFVLARCENDEALADAIRVRSNRDPSELALESLDRAIADLPGERAARLRDSRAFLMTRVIAAAIRTGDMARAIATLDATIELMRSVAAADAAKPWIVALGKIRPHLRDEARDLEALRDDPYLAEIVEALESR